MTRDDVLDNITLFWLKYTFVSAGQLYWENKHTFFGPKGVRVPVAVSVFPDELYQAPPQLGSERYPNRVHYSQLDRGGHFVAWDQPKIFIDELRAGVRGIRT